MPINIQELKPASLKAKEVATQEYVDNSVPEGMVTTDTLISEINAAETQIDGGRITTGSLSAISANLGTINAGVVYGGSDLVAGNEEVTYGMKIDLANGSIHIK